MVESRGRWDRGLLIRAQSSYTSRLTNEGTVTDTEGLLMLLAANDFESCERLVESLAIGRAVMLVDPRLPVKKILSIFDTYRPQTVVFPSTRQDIRHELGKYSSGQIVSDDEWHVSGNRDEAIHPDLALLLSTSGTTGSPKFVRLSKSNIDSNAQQIAESLNLVATDVGITALPIHYSFGFSILNSHLAVQSPVVVTDTSILEATFWDLCVANNVTVIAGVPSTYEMILRLKLYERFPDSLRLLIQAGGRLRNEAQLELSEIMKLRNGEFLPMYGQTEASPRIACMPPGRLQEKIGSVGKALNGGRLTIEDPALDSQIGAVTYRGPNVMFGYADSWRDLILGDQSHQILKTGDLGYLDKDGFLFLTGRTKRIAKINGVRVSLDEVEEIAGRWGTNMAIGNKPDLISVFFENPEFGLPNTKELAQAIGIPLRNLSIHEVTQLPTFNSGKRNYKELEELNES